jgi:magnesium transporter
MERASGLPAPYDAPVPTLPLPRPHLRRDASRPDPMPDGPETADRRVIEAVGLRWYSIERPREADRDWLENEFGFHPLDLEDVASRNQRPKLDSYDEYLFIVLHFPVFDKPSGRLLTAEVDLFVGPDFLITLPNEPLPPLAAMFDRLESRDDQREQTFAKGPGYLLYKLVDTCVDASFPMLRKTGLKLERIEDEIFEGRSREVVRDISDAKQEIINFRKIVRPMRAVLRDLERTKQRYLHEDLEIYFDDISDAAERMWDILENFKEVAEGLEDTNESVLSHRLNDSLRILTAVSVILLPLTLVASIFGMNVRVPGEGDPTAFWALIIGMAALLIVLVMYFRRRGWL